MRLRVVADIPESGLSDIRHHPPPRLPDGRLKRNKIKKPLTSSSCHPKVFVKEFCYFLMSCHQHCLGVNLLVQR